MRRLSLLLALPVLLGLAGPALAVGDPNDPNWPCVQRKVLELSAAASWTGPAYDPTLVKSRDKPEVETLVNYLAQRRVSIDEAKAAIADFSGRHASDRAEALTAVYAGLFETLNAERKDVIAGILRFARKQRTMADSVKASQAALDALRADPKADFQAMQTKADEVVWETRVFEERQKSLTFVCEVPVIIEQRLFALGKAIAEAAK